MYNLYFIFIFISFYFVFMNLFINYRVFFLLSFLYSCFHLYFTSYCRLLFVYFHFSLSISFVSVSDVLIHFYVAFLFSLLIFYIGFVKLIYHLFILSCKFYLVIHMSDTLNSGFSCVWLNLCVFFFFLSGLQRVHDARDEPAAGTESDTADHAEGNRANGANHPQEVQLHPGTAEAEHVRSRHDPQVEVSRRKVSEEASFLHRCGRATQFSRDTTVQSPA